MAMFTIPKIIIIFYILKKNLQIFPYEFFLLLTALYTRLLQGAIIKKEE